MINHETGLPGEAGETPRQQPEIMRNIGKQGLFFIEVKRNLGSNHIKPGNAPNRETEEKKDE